MSDELVLYYNPQSRAAIAHYMLEEVGAPYRLEHINFEKRENKTPAFLAMNPMGKLPTLVHRGTVVTEAGAICAYLADAFPEAGLAPSASDPSRGTYLRWLFFGAGCVEPAIVDKLFDRPEVPRKGALGYGSYEDTLHALETAVSPGPFVLGERFSAADVYLGSQLAWGMMVRGLESRPAFNAYLQHIAERPAYKRYRAQSEALMAAMKAAK